MLRDLIIRNRSCRRFHEEESLGRDVLVSLVDLARLSASAGNLQPLKYILSCDPGKNTVIFRYLAWAAYLQEWAGPPDGERPPAYIIILGDIQISPSTGCDHGIAAQSILLGATELGLGGCIIGSINREGLREALEIPSRYEILVVLAIGRPRETIVLESVSESGDIRYWRDSQNIHHVPKRPLEDIITG